MMAAMMTMARALRLGAFRSGPVIPIGMADIVDRHVVMLAPEERHGIEDFALAQHVARGGLALALRHHPMFDADVLAGMRIGPAGDVARRVDATDAGFEIRIHRNAAID